jgi:hypothetical protein
MVFGFTQHMLDECSTPMISGDGSKNYVPPDQLTTRMVANYCHQAAGVAMLLLRN